MIRIGGHAKKRAPRPRRDNATRQRAPRGAGSVTQLQNGKWQARVRRFGRDIKRSFDTQAEALQALEKLRRNIGTQNATLGKMRLADWLERYRTEEGPKLKRRTRDLHGYYQSLATPCLGRIPLSEVSPSDLREYQNNLLEYAASTQKQAWNFVAAALRRAFEDDIISSNPADKVRPPKGGRVAERNAWTRDETTKALGVLRGHKLEMLIRFMLTTGMRPGEALALRWRDIQVSALRVEVRQTVERAGKNPVFTTPKTPTSDRVFYLDPETLAMLETHRAQQSADRATARRWTDYGLVFPSAFGTPLDHRSMRRTMEFISTRAAVRHLTPHELRHTHRTLAKLAGISSKVTSSRMGHSSERITEGYDHSHQDDHEQRRAAVPLSVLARIPLVSLTDNATPQKQQSEAKDAPSSATAANGAHLDSDDVKPETVKA